MLYSYTTFSDKFHAVVVGFPGNVSFFIDFTNCGGKCNPTNKKVWPNEVSVNLNIPYEDLWNIQFLELVFSQSILLAFLKPDLFKKIVSKYDIYISNDTPCELLSGPTDGIQMFLLYFESFV